jgi:phage terminase small subunit
MRKKAGAFTPKERVFIDRFVASGDKVLAAKLAGFAHADRNAGQVANRPDVVRAVHALQLERIQSEVLPLAVERHLALLNDKQCTGQVLNRAIEMAYKYGLAAGADGAKKQPHEMTAEELAQAIDALKRAAADAAKPVLDLEPIAPGASVFE